MLVPIPGVEQLEHACLRVELQVRVTTGGVGEVALRRGGKPKLDAIVLDWIHICYRLPSSQQSPVFGTLLRCTGSLLLTSHRLIFVSARRKPGTEVRPSSPKMGA